MPTEFKMCKCGICETDCEYHKPELPAGYTIATANFTDLLKQMYPQKAIEGAFFFGSGEYASDWTGLKGWIPADGEGSK